MVERAAVAFRFSNIHVHELLLLGHNYSLVCIFLCELNTWRRTNEWVKELTFPWTVLSPSFCARELIPSTSLFSTSVNKQLFVSPSNTFRLRIESWLKGGINFLLSTVSTTLKSTVWVHLIQRYLWVYFLEYGLLSSTVIVMCRNWIVWRT